ILPLSEFHKDFCEKSENSFKHEFSGDLDRYVISREWPLDCRKRSKCATDYTIRAGPGLSEIGPKNTIPERSRFRPSSWMCICPKWRRRFCLTRRGRKSRGYPSFRNQAGLCNALARPYKKECKAEGWDQCS